MINRSIEDSTMSYSCHLLTNILFRKNALVQSIAFIYVKDQTLLGDLRLLVG